MSSLSLPPITANRSLRNSLPENHMHATNSALKIKKTNSKITIYRRVPLQSLHITATEISLLEIETFFLLSVLS